MLTNYIPIPLFDSLEFLDSNILQISKIKSHLPAQLSVETILSDFKNSFQFLLSYRGSEDTFNAYRREVERLIQWSWFVHKKTLRDLRRNDFEIYFGFCQSPIKSWIGTKHVSRFINKNGARIPNPVWRPFVVQISKKAHNDGKIPDIKSYSFSQNALKLMFAILSSFCNFLYQENYIPGNPISQIRQKSKFLRTYHSKKIIRRLSETQWSYIFETAENLAKEDPVKHQRTLFIMSALYGMYLRISELAATSRWVPIMGNFFKDSDGNWWFKTVGKGNKERDISVSMAMLDALKKYRASRGLLSLPSPGEANYLITVHKRNSPLKGTRHIRKIVQECFDKTVERLNRDRLFEDAEVLMTATVHWLRHTGISDDVKMRPREHVRDDAGHSSSAITDKYIDIELRERHESGKRKLIKY